MTERFIYGSELLTRYQICKNQNLTYHAFNTMLSDTDSKSDISKSVSLKRRRSFKTQPNAYSYRNELLTCTEISKISGKPLTSVLSALQISAPAEKSDVTKVIDSIKPNTEIRGQKYVFCGKQYTLSELARDFGINLCSLRHYTYLRVNLIVEGDIFPAIAWESTDNINGVRYCEFRKRRKLYSHQGTAKTAKHISAITGLSVKTVKIRYRQIS